MQFTALESVCSLKHLQWRKMHIRSREKDMSIGDIHLILHIWLNIWKTMTKACSVDPWGEGLAWFHSFSKMFSEFQMCTQKIRFCSIYIDSHHLYTSWRLSNSDTSLESAFSRLLSGYVGIDVCWDDNVLYREAMILQPLATND